MLKRLERDAIKADLSAAEALLNERTEEDDPIGYLQFSKRVSALNRRLQEIEASPQTGAEIGLFFGGNPVLGSHGIMADFGANVLSEFQTLISSSFAATDGALGTRGPVPHRDKTRLLLTDVARGSFGFILKQAEEPDLVDSPLKEVVSQAVDLVFRVASPDQEAFEGIAERVDSRVLGSLKSFFQLIDDARATVRFVGDEREFTLQRGEVALGRERTENAVLDEREEDASGTLYILPAARRFELHPQDGGNPIKGTIAPDCLTSLTGGGTEVLPGIIGTMQLVRMRVREIRSQGHASKRSYILLTLSNLARPQISVF